MIRRVYENQHGIITLDSDLFGTRKRISTGKKADKYLLKYYEKNFDDEFKKIYNEKYNIKPTNSTEVKLLEYGLMVLDLTKDNRRDYVHNLNINAFKRICGFKIDNKTFGDMILSDIKSTDIMRWQKGCGLAPQTIATNRAYLNIVLETAMNDDIIRKNPIKSVKLPKRTSVRDKTYYSEDEIKKIISLAKGQLKNYIQLACFTGMRGSELIGLKWDDIDFKKEVIRVDSRIVLGVDDDTKSGKTRFIPMFKQAKEALLKQQLFCGLSEHVFISKFGGSYYNSTAMRVSFQKLLENNGIKRGTIHDLRRSFNTLLKQYGYPNDWILDVMGHMDDKVNRNHYTGSLQVDMTKIGDIAL